MSQIAKNTGQTAPTNINTNTMTSWSSNIINKTNYINIISNNDSINIKKSTTLITKTTARMTKDKEDKGSFEATIGPGSDKKYLAIKEAVA